MRGGVEHCGHAFCIYRSGGEHIATLITGRHVRVDVPERSECREVSKLAVTLRDRIKDLILADGLYLGHRSRFVRGLLRFQQVRDGYCCDDSDDRYDDQQLN